MNSLVIDNPIYEEILLERHQQDLKWGVQDHPSISDKISKGPNSNVMDKICRYYGIPTQDKAQYDVEKAAKEGNLSWSHIAVEELSEVISATSEEHRRHELIQLAAVCIAWCENIDRKKKDNDKK